MENALDAYFDIIDLDVFIDLRMQKNTDNTTKLATQCINLSCVTESHLNNEAVPIFLNAPWI